MKVFIGSFSGHYFRGYSVIVSKDAHDALEKLYDEVIKQGLGEDNTDLSLDDIVEVDTTKPSMGVLWDGDY